MLFKCSIPVDHHISKKNSMRIWQGRVGKSPELQIAEDVLLNKLHLERLKQRLDHTITCDIAVKFTFVFKDYLTKKKSKKDVPRRSRKVCDLSNLFQMPEDCLTKAGIIGDDSQICSYDGSRRIPGLQNRLDIEITEFKE